MRRKQLNTIVILTFQLIHLVTTNRADNECGDVETEPEGEIQWNVPELTA
jgi:hypothetical protein